MTPLQILLVLLTCLTQMYWNFEVKRAAEPNSFAWGVQLFGGIFALVLVPFVADKHVPPQGWLCVAGSAVCYAGYFGLIAKSYERGDLSVGYPIIRGIAVVAAAVLDVALFHERPSLMGGAGVVAICVAVFLLARPKEPIGVGGVGHALVGGLFAAGYGLIDKAGVHFVDPILYLALTMLAGSTAQLTVVGSKRSQLLSQIGPRLLLSALAASMGYLVVLKVLQSAPVSYVIPVRATVVLLSVFVGARALDERVTTVRYIAAGLVLCGIVAIGLGK